MIRWRERKSASKVTNGFIYQNDYFSWKVLSFLLNFQELGGLDVLSPTPPLHPHSDVGRNVESFKDNSRLPGDKSVTKE